MKEEWIFTFGYGQPLEGKCVRIAGTYGEARQKMIKMFGTQWAFQYSAQEWDKWKEDPSRAWMMEKEIEYDIRRTYGDYM